MITAVAECSAVAGVILAIWIVTAAVAQGEIRAWLGRRREARTAERRARPARPPMGAWGTAAAVIWDETHVPVVPFAAEDADTDSAADAPSLPRRVPGAWLATDRLPEAPYHLLHAMYEDVRRILTDPEGNR